MKRLVHFDSISAFYPVNPFNASFPVQHNIRDIKRISLKSAEIPVNFANIRYGLNTFTINMSSTNYTITLNPNVYTSIATLCTDITNAFASSGMPYLPTFSATGSYVSITVSGNHPFSVVQTNMSRYVLGFNGIQSSSYSTNSVITAGYSYLLNVDNYISIYLANVPQTNSSCGGTLMSFKIPVNCVNGVILIIGDQNSFQQSIDVTDPNFVLSALNVVVYDRFNNIIDNNGSDWSFTLQIE